MRDLCNTRILKLLVPLVLAAVVVSPDHVTSSAVQVKEDVEFCSRRNDLLDCNFRKTDQVVELEEAEAGIREVKVTSANRFRGRPPCGTSLKIWSSFNISLLGRNAADDTLETDAFSKPFAPGNETRSGGKSHGNRETVNEHIPIRFPSDDPPARTTESDGGSEPAARDPKAGDEEGCIGNASLRQSNVHRLKGDFDLVSLHSSQVQSIDGRFNNLVVKRSEIVKLSGTGFRMNIEGSPIQEIQKLTVLNSLQLRQVSLKQLLAPGMHLRQVLHDDPDGSVHVHEMNFTDIGSMQTGKIIVNGSQLVMNSVVINQTGAGSIAVEGGGKATLNNVSIRRGTDLCLVLRGNAQVILNNFTLGGSTIDHLSLSIENFAWPVYPLRAQTSLTKQTSVKIRPHTRANSGGAEGGGDGDDEDPEFIGMDWYWLPVMMAVGLISGMVVGLSMNCSGSEKKSKGLSSSLTFSDLIARERCEEENRCNGVVGPQRPDLVRQDSGLTSSSFASYTVCADRRLSSVKHIDEFDTGLIDTADPNLFIHVPPLVCTREDVIYEEVEALPPTSREENQYVNMNSVTA